MGLFFERDKTILNYDVIINKICVFLLFSFFFYINYYFYTQIFYLYFENFFNYFWCKFFSNNLVNSFLFQFETGFIQGYINNLELPYRFSTIRHFEIDKDIYRRAWLHSGTAKTYTTKKLFDQRNFIALVSLTTNRYISPFLDGPYRQVLLYNVSRQVTSMTMFLDYNANSANYGRRVYFLPATGSKFSLLRMHEASLYRYGGYKRQKFARVITAVFYMPKDHCVYWTRGNERNRFLTKIFLNWFKVYNFAPMVYFDGYNNIINKTNFIGYVKGNLLPDIYYAKQSLHITWGCSNTFIWKCVAHIKRATIEYIDDIIYYASGRTRVLYKKAKVYNIYPTWRGVETDTKIFPITFDTYLFIGISLVIAHHIGYHLYSISLDYCSETDDAAFMKTWIIWACTFLSSCSFFLY